MPFFNENCLSAWLAILFILCVLGLLYIFIKRWKSVRAQKRERQLQRLNHHAEMRRQHNSYLARMDEALESVNRGRSA